MPLSNIDVSVSINVGLVNDLEHVLVTDQLGLLRVYLFERPYHVVSAQPSITVLVELFEY